MVKLFWINGNLIDVMQIMVVDTNNELANRLSIRKFPAEMLKSASSKEFIITGSSLGMSQISKV